jgi:hypothetical protein
MDPKQQQIWHAKRLISVAARATAHAAKRIRQGLPARIALQRSDRLIRLSHAAWNEAIA